MEYFRIEIRKMYFLIVLCSLYLTISFACCFLAFRVVTINGYVFGASALVYGSIYILIDAITQLTSSKTCIKLILIFNLCKFTYVYMLYTVNYLPAPANPLITAYSIIIPPIMKLFWSDLAGSLIAAIMDILIFSSLQRRIKNFFIASVISTSLVTISHNIPTNYFALRHIFPEQYWQITFINGCLAILAILISSSIINFAMRKV